MKKYIVGIVIFSLLSFIMLLALLGSCLSADSAAACVTVAIIAGVFLFFDILNCVLYTKSRRAKKVAQQQSHNTVNNLSATVQDTLINSIEITAERTEDMPHYPCENDEQPAVNMFVFDVNGNCSRSDGKPLTNADVTYLMCHSRDNVLNDVQDRTDSRGLPTIPRDIAFQAHSAVQKYSQVRNELRILVESYEIAASTVNCETFCMRFELMQEKAHTLLSAESNNVRGIKQLNCHDFCVTLLNNSQVIKRRFLIDYEHSEFQSMEKLKTSKGKINRLKKILTELTNAATILAEMQEYDNLLIKTQDYIVSLGGTSEINF